MVWVANCLDDDLSPIFRQSNPTARQASDDHQCFTKPIPGIDLDETKPFFLERFAVRLRSRGWRPVSEEIAVRPISELILHSHALLLRHNSTRLTARSFAASPR